MHILAVNWQDQENPQAGGAEVHLFEILERLVARGHRVSLLCSGFDGAPARASIRGVDIHRTGGRYTFPLHARAYFRRHLASTGIDVILEDINKVPLLTPRWTATVPVVALIPHLFGTTAFAELPAAVALVVWAAERPIPFMYRDSLFHAISESTAADLVRRGVDPDAITVIYPGIDIAHYTPDPARREATPLFAYLGRLKRYKGVDLIIRAFATLPAGSARLEIAGTGDYRNRLEQLAVSLGVEERVSFLGFVSEEQKLDLLRRAWSLVFTSPKEGWGITNLESQSCGTMVIASDSPGLRESVRNGRTGILVEHANISALASAMASVAASLEVAERLGGAGREFAAEFSWESTASKTEEHLALAVSRGRTR